MIRLLRDIKVFIKILYTLMFAMIWMGLEHRRKNK